MFKYAAMALSVALMVGCTTNHSYDTLYDKVAYTYDHDLKRSLVKGPAETPIYNSKYEFSKFRYNMSIDNGDTQVNIYLKYRDSQPRSFSHAIDTTGRVYNFVKHDKYIIDCGANGSVNSGTCIYRDSISFKMPDDRQSQFILVGSDGRNASFKINREYIAVMSDVTYRLKTPRADSDELRVKKDALVMAAPKPLPTKSVTPPAPKPEPVYQPVVNAVPAQQPIAPVTTPVQQGSYIDKYKTVETCQCSSSPQSTSTITSVKTTTVKKQVPSKQPVVQQPAKKVVTAKPVKAPTLTPVNKDPFCSNVVFKTCATVSNCREAYDQLACGNKKLDPSKKGMPCPNVCKL